MATRLHNRDYYDEFSKRYEHGRDAGYHAMLDRLESEIALRYARHADVLEAGCGTGLILRRLAPETRRAIGLDLSAGMLGHARRRGLDVVQGSITELPFANDSFDVVCSFKVLAHVERIRDALAELGRVTRPGGHLVLEFYNPWSLRGLVKRLKPATPVGDATHDEHVFTRYDTLSDVRAMLPRGFEVVDLRGVRVVTPAAAVFALPAVGKVFDFVENRACDAPVLRRLGGFLIVVARKPNDGERAAR